MLGEPLTEAAEAPGPGAGTGPPPRRTRCCRAGVDRRPRPGRRAADTLLLGPARAPPAAPNLFGALRRAMAKAGYSDLKEFQKVGLTIRL